MIIEKPAKVKKENVFKYNGEPVKMTLGTLILTCLCIFMIIIATFTQISFTHFIIPADVFSYLGDGITSADIKITFEILQIYSTSACNTIHCCIVG